MIPLVMRYSAGNCCGVCHSPGEHACHGVSVFVTALESMHAMVFLGVLHLLAEARFLLLCLPVLSWTLSPSTSIDSAYERDLEETLEWSKDPSRVTATSVGTLISPTQRYQSFPTRTPRFEDPTCTFPGP